jgi:hypothetical protein
MALLRVSGGAQEISNLTFLEPGKIIGEAPLEFKDASLLKGSLSELKVLLRSNTTNLQNVDASLHIVAVMRNLQHIWLQRFDVHRSLEEKEPDNSENQNSLSPRLILVPATDENGSGASRVVQFLQFGARPVRNSILKLVQNSKTEQTHLLVLRSKSELVFYDPHTLEPRTLSSPNSLTQTSSETFKLTTGQEAIFDFQCLEAEENKLLVAAVTTSQRIHVWKIAGSAVMKEEAKLQLDVGFLPNPMLEWSNCQLQFCSTSELALFWTQADELKVKKLKLDFNSKSSKVEGSHDKVFKIKDGLNSLKKNFRMYVFSYKEPNKPQPVFRAQFVGPGITKALVITFGTVPSAVEKIISKSKLETE